MLLLISSIIACLIILLFLYLSRPKQKLIIPSTRWRNGNLRVTVLYIDKERVYFITENECICSLYIKDFATYFVEEETQ